MGMWGDCTPQKPRFTNTFASQSGCMGWENASESGAGTIVPGETPFLALFVSPSTDPASTLYALSPLWARTTLRILFTVRGRAVPPNHLERNAGVVVAAVQLRERRAPLGSIRHGFTHLRLNFTFVCRRSGTEAISPADAFGTALDSPSGRVDGLESDSRLSEAIGCCHGLGLVLPGSSSILRVGATL
jgi:hypothetical protein